MGVIDSIYYTIIHYKLNRRNTLKFSDSKAIQVITHLRNTYELDMVSEKEMNNIFQKESDDYIPYIVANTA